MSLVMRKDELFADDDVSFICNFNPGDSLVARARNNLAHNFLRTDADYLLFLDTDLDFSPEDIKKLIDRRRDDAVVCGQYAIKQPELRYCYNKIQGEQVGPDGLLKVGEAGTGCMLIPRKILEDIRDKMPALAYTDDVFRDKRVSFFNVGVVGGRYLSEDWLFCRYCYQLGYSVYVHTEILLGHHGWMRYPLPEPFLVEAVASRCPNQELLDMFKSKIDIAAHGRWTQLSPPA